MGRQQRGLDAIRRIDFLGNILIIAACTLLVFALQEAGAYSFAWNHPVIVLALVVSVLSWLGFAAWELSLGSREDIRIEPILPLRLMGRVYSACVMYVAVSPNSRLSHVLLRLTRLVALSVPALPI